MVTSLTYRAAKELALLHGQDAMLKLHQHPAKYFSVPTPDTGTELIPKDELSVYLQVILNGVRDSLRPQ